MIKYKNRIVIPAAALLLLNGCAESLLFQPHEVSRQTDAGDVHVAAIAVAPWQEYVDKLTPKFELKSGTALGEVIAQTASFERQVRDALGVKVRLAGPTSATSETISEIVGADSVVTQTRESASQNNSGSFEDLEGADATAPTPSLTSSLALPASAQEPGLEPIFKYTAATALLQEVNLLNNYVKAAAHRHNMVPYVLRMQITLAPYARHQPYDHHITMSFFSQYVGEPKEKTTKSACSDSGSGKRSWRYRDTDAVVVPLLVTDALERTTALRTANIVRQFSLAATALQGGIAASLGLDTRFEKLNAILANDFNSVMTVGRPTSGSIYVRLGAMQEATAKYATVPRTHNVTLLVMVPDGVRFTKKEALKNLMSAVTPARTLGEVERLRVSGSVQIRHALTGETLERIGKKARRNRMRSAILAQTDSKGDSKKLSDDSVLRCLQIALFRNDFTAFEEQLEKTLGRAVSADAAWNAAIESLGATGVFGERIDLPIPPTPSLPDNTQIAQIHDNATLAKVSLAGGANLSHFPLGAKLNVRVGAEMMSVPAKSIKFSKTGADPVIEFPTLTSLIKKEDFTEFKQLGGASIQLFDKPRASYSMRSRPLPEKAAKRKFSNVFYKFSKKALPKKATPGAATYTTTTVIKSEKSRGLLRIHVKFQKVDGKKPTKVIVSIANADISKVAGGAVLKLGKVEFSAEGTAMVTLENLDQTIPVVLTSAALIGDKPLGTKISDVRIRVSEIRSARK